MAAVARDRTHRRYARKALRLIEQASNPLPVIVVVSDGGENASGTTLRQAGGDTATKRNADLRHAYRLAALAVSRRPSIARSANFLPEMVGDSGGTVYQVRKPEGGEAAARALLEELRSQYTLGYVPKRAADGKYPAAEGRIHATRNICRASSRRLSARPRARDTMNRSRCFPELRADCQAVA